MSTREEDRDPTPATRPMEDAAASPGPADAEKLARGQALMHERFAGAFRRLAQ